MKSIRSTLTIFNSIAIALVSAAVLYIALTVYENLYTESVAADVDALTENMSNDLMPYLAQTEPDIFSITTTLLRLDRYENVKYAHVIDIENGIVQSYTGKAFSDLNEVPESQVPTITYAETEKLGVIVTKHEIVAIKQIGDHAFPLGKMVIVFDLEKPLQMSKYKLIQQALPLASAVMIIALIVSLWLHRDLLSPLVKLASLAHEIKQTHDYSINLDVKGKTEVTDLSQEFDAMMRAIHAQETKVQEYTVQLAEQNNRMEQLANFDELTGICNRQYFLSQLETLLLTRSKDIDELALLYVDLDGFKNVNDSFGHDIGDKLLQAVTTRLKNAITAEHILCRFGGDEFLILFTKAINKDGIDDIAARILDRLQKVFQIEEWKIQISGSIGISFIRDSHYQLDRLISNSDTAMYAAKNNGRNNAVYFNANMLLEAKSRLNLVNALTPAIKQRQFSLYYQAKVDQDGHIIGFEGLLRWIHHIMGFISPQKIIDVAEKSGKIGQITDFVIEQACSDIKTLVNQFGSHIVVSVNLSSHDLVHEMLASKIRSLFAKYSVNPRNIQFEVTESAYLQNFEQANRFFNQVSSMGCSIALDDFGTGYSSLSYLTKINIDTIKIDREFVAQFGKSDRDNLVTASIIHLAKQLKLKICAEGVETQEQAELLLEEGCDHLQGYLFHRPEPLEKVLRLNDQIIQSNVVS